MVKKEEAERVTREDICFAKRIDPVRSASLVRSPPDKSATQCAGQSLVLPPDANAGFPAGWAGLKQGKKLAMVGITN